MREADVRHQAASEKGRDPALRTVEELIGNQEIERPVLLLQAADGAGRKDELDAERLEAEDVRAEVEFGRQQPMAGAMAREKRHALAAERADDVGRGRVAEGRLHLPLFAVGELRHVVQTAAADDADANHEGLPPKDAQSDACRHGRTGMILQATRSTCLRPFSSLM